MKINKDKNRIWCDKCNKWIDIMTETYEPDGYDEGRICCLHEITNTKNPEEEIGTHLLGFVTDKEWIEIYG